jgi:hypothetical protein
MYGDGAAGVTCRGGGGADSSPVLCGVGGSGKGLTTTALPPNWRAADTVEDSISSSSRRSAAAAGVADALCAAIVGSELAARG